MICERLWLMRNVLAILCLFMVSCGNRTSPLESHGRFSARDSTYKTETMITVDTSALFPDEDQQGGGDAKATKKSEIVDFVDQGELLKTGEHTGTTGWWGTAWVAEKRSGATFLMTAGHICETGRFYHYEYIDWSTWSIVEVDLPIVKKEHTLISRDGARISAEPVLDEDTDGDMNGNDLCVLVATGDLGPVIPIATEDPEDGQTCDVVGAPHGIWGGGVTPSADAKFSGRGSPFEVKPDGLVFNGDMHPGNSGSAITCGGKAVGVLSLGMSTVFQAVPYERMTEFLNRALHRRP